MDQIEKPADAIIGWVTGQDCAHFAVLFKTAGGGMIFESNLLGTHPAFFKTWMKNRTIIHQLEVEVSPDEENAIWDKWVDKFDGQQYDYLGVLYCGLMIARERLFKIPRPKKNPWASANAFFCDEVYQLVSGLPGFPKLCPIANGMDSPHDVWEKIRQ